MTVLPPDPYRVLGVPKDAQIPEIRSAHRKLVLKCHPDKIQDPALKEAKQIEFQQVQQAYELLSNEIERERYDRRAEVYERERERERGGARTSAARATSSTPKRDPPIFYNVKEASPRANTFAKSSPYGRTPPRSWEDTTTAARMFEEATRQARKAASYEKEKPSKRDEERRRREENKEWERERAKAKEREAREARKAKERKEEKERSARDREEREKEKRKDEKKKAQSDREREREKERKSAAAEKHRSRQPPIIDEIDSGAEASNSDVEYQPVPPKSERKKSSSGHKPEDIDPPLPPSSERTRKLSGNMETAIRYLARSSGKPPSFLRAQTFTEGTSSKSYATPMVPVPTPPPAATPFAPPPPPVEEPEEMSDDDIARRSSARPSRRMSHDTPRSSREKSSLHKKSSSSRDHQPIIVEAGSPPVRAAPTLSRSHTESYARPIPVPGMSRAETWYPTTERERERHERHERSRSRPTPGYTDSEESDDDRDRRHRRNRRTQSPKPMTAHVQYAVDSNGTKSIPIRQKQYHEQPPRGAYKVKGGFAVPNSSARLHRGRTATYYYEEERGQHFPPSGVKYSTQFGEHDIRYSDLPYGGSSSYHQTNVYA